jgi:ketosteroid isomerase-like protein
MSEHAGKPMAASAASISPEFARSFAREWIDAWNSHDLDRILAHYCDDFEMSSPVIVQLMGEPSGRLRGKAAIRAYWSKALARHPALIFELEQVLVGAGSVTIVYRGHRGLSAEVLWFDADGRVRRAAAHYVEPPAGS